MVDICRDAAAAKKGCIQMDEILEYFEGAEDDDDDDDDNNKDDNGKEDDDDADVDADDAKKKGETEAKDADETADDDVVKKSKNKEEKPVPRAKSKKILPKPQASPEQKEEQPPSQSDQEKDKNNNNNNKEKDVESKGEDEDIDEQVKHELRNKKLLALFDIMQVWKHLHRDTINEVAEQMTETYLIKLLRDFCGWNTHEDDAMRIVLEKNALSKLVDMDSYFEPVQRRVEHIAEGVVRLCETKGSSPQSPTHELHNM